MAVGLGKTQLNADTKYNFFASATIYNIKPAYDYFVKNYPDKKRLAIVLPDNPETDFVKNSMKKVIDSHNIPIVFNDVYAEGTQDFNPIVTKALASNPDAIDLGFCIPPWEKAIITGARDLGFKGPIFGSLLLGDPHLLNSMISSNYAYDIFSTGSVDVTSPKMPSMVKELGKKLKRDNTIFNMDSTTLIEAIYPLLQAIEEAQSFDPDKVVSAFENMKNIDTLYGPGVVGGQDSFGINHVVIRAGTLSRIMNGKVEFEYVEQ
jgi:branched-chain amino acid transport system substrate-binding protein